METAPAQVARENPKASSRDIMKLIGERWKALDPEAKEKCAGASLACRTSVLWRPTLKAALRHRYANCAPR